MTVRLVFPVMGTMSSMVVPAHEVSRLGRATVDEALQAARSELARLDLTFSHYRADSDIERWSRGESIEAAARIEIDEVLARCAELQQDSGGAFTTTNPLSGRLDTAGFVKGYAIGRAALVLNEAGMTAYGVGVGGDAQFRGESEPGRMWQVAIADPTRSHAVAAVVPVTDGAVATSGRAERGDHIWLVGGADSSRPHSVASFTVTGPDIALADAYATIGFAMGPSGAAWVASHPGYSSVVIGVDGRMEADARLVSAV